MAIVRKAAKRGTNATASPERWLPASGRAVAAGVGTFLGIRLLKRKFGSGNDTDEQSNESGEQSDAAN